MASPLDQTNRRQGAEYHNEVVAPLQGVNLDANDATIGKGEMRQCLNWRLNTLGDLQVRSGYAEFEQSFSFNQDGGPLYGDPGVPIAQMEYVVVVSNTNAAVASELQTTYNYVVTAVWKKVTGLVVLVITDKDGTNGFPVQTFPVTNFQPSAWLPTFGK